jgi:hypothetical protein
MLASETALMLVSPALASQRMSAWADMAAAVVWLAAAKCSLIDDGSFLRKIPKKM